MNAHTEYRRWLECPWLDRDTRHELLSIRSDDAEISSRFSGSLLFGTGGLRGVMGAGTSRMNVYTLRQATAGLALYLKAHKRAPLVCIAYDTRCNSDAFALAAAETLCGNGIQVRLFPEPRPTPMLSYAVRYYGADAGIVITASHNPPEYNGYKVYDSNGCQITDNAATLIQRQIRQIDVMAKPTGRFDETKLHAIRDPFEASYYSKVKSILVAPEMVMQYGHDLQILYSPLHGTGARPVCRALFEAGFRSVQTVSAQESPDGTFPTVVCPNPENPEAFSYAFQAARTCNPDIILMTDPDCDRLGVAVKEHMDHFKILNGNQIGALLCSYILSFRKEKGNLPENAAIVKTIATSDLAKKICADYGVAIHETLTGFKYIGELIGVWERGGRNHFLFGFEESCGYLSGMFVRDKDAVIASVLVCEMALYYKRQNLTLLTALENLHRRYGYCCDRLLTLPATPSLMEAVMQKVSCVYEALLDEAPVAIENYIESARYYFDGRVEPIDLPKTRAVKLIYRNGWILFRPSGTESKFKVYLSVNTGNPGSSLAILEQWETAINCLIASC